MSKELKETKIEDAPTEEVLSTEEIIVQVLNAYVEQELGNKVTQFSVQGLMQILVGAIKQGESIT